MGIHIYNVKRMNLSIIILVTFLDGRYLYAYSWEKKKKKLTKPNLGIREFVFIVALRF